MQLQTSCPLALALGIVLSLGSALPAVADEPVGSIENLPFHQYDPPSTLVVPEHPVPRARFPFIDVHNHQWQLPTQDLEALAAEMDALNMAVMVNLSGRGFQRVEQEDGSFRFALHSEEFLAQGLENIRQSLPGRMVVFTNLDFEGFGESGWTEAAVADLERDVGLGAVGLKIYKSLGFDVVDPDGRRVAVDDSRLDPVWHKCGELGIPVLIHSGEPSSFWKPKDAQNERLLELIQRPERYRDPAEVPSWEQIMGEQHRVFRKHPDTVFINAHLGWMGNDLAALGRLLDELPNVYTEIGAVLAELGRQPRFARQWFIDYQDRVMFGKDSWRPEEYPVYFRVLETADEYFDYYRRRHAFWKMYGLDLPDEVLKKLYYKNALQVIPGIDASLFPE